MWPVFIISLLLFFAIGIFAYLTYATPQQILLLLPWWLPWWIDIIFAFVLTIIYFCIFLYQRSSVENKNKRWPIVSNFILYILIFTSLTFGFGRIKVFEDYYVYEGFTKVNNSDTFLAKVNINITKADDQPITGAISDTDGRFTY
jgi:hypothetical protein